MAGTDAAVARGIGHFLPGGTACTMPR